jgi:hypothetical protein
VRPDRKPFHDQQLRTRVLGHPGTHEGVPAELKPGPEAVRFGAWQFSASTVSA